LTISFKSLQNRDHFPVTRSAYHGGVTLLDIAALCGLAALGSTDA
jgi:hypothetical protein